MGIEEEHAILSVSEFKDYYYDGFYPGRAVSFKIDVENIGTTDLSLLNFIGIFKLITDEGLKVGFIKDTSDQTLDSMSSLVPGGKTSFIISNTIKTESNLANLLLFNNIFEDSADTYIFELK